MLKKRERLLALVLVGIALVAMILLSAGISQLDFFSGQPFSLERRARTQVAGGRVTLGGDFMGTVILALFAFTQLLVPFAIIYFLISPEARRRVLKSLGHLTWLVALFLLMRSLMAPLGSEEEAQSPDTVPLSEELSNVEFVANPPQWLVLVASLVVAVLLASAVIGILWYVYRRRRQRANPLEKLAQEAQDALDALHAGRPWKDTVRRCYFEMSRVLRDQQGISRDKTMTTREFERHLVEAGLPREHVRGLTRLFEEVRYGAKVAGEPQEREAITCLTAIVETSGRLP